MKQKIKIWLECFRLRTLPVSLSGVVIAIGLAVWHHCFQWIPAMLCLVFAVLAQIVSNTANEYFDYLHGADKPGRVGPRRGVTEGDIKPDTLRNVTFGLLAAACAVGCCLIPYGGWWLLPVGIIIALLASHDSAYVRFHLRQALKFIVVETLTLIVSGILVWTFIVPIAGGIFTAILGVLQIICFFQICGGKAKEPAIIRSLGFLK
jgi:uncharacterized membrane protein